VWADLRLSAAWSIALCWGLATGIACWPFTAECLWPWVTYLFLGPVAFFPAVILETVCVTFLLFRITGVRRLLVRPGFAVGIFALHYVLGYFFAPHGQGF